jgi:prenylcysteine oxidase/farnesylcysteine lyase
MFNSYPKTFPRVTFQDPIVGTGVYYTSGIESFVSSMETSALMGKNVARLIVDDMMAGGPIKARDAARDNKRNVLN